MTDRTRWKVRTFPEAQWLVVSKVVSLVTSEEVLFAARGEVIHTQNATGWNQGKLLTYSSLTTKINYLTKCSPPPLYFLNHYSQAEYEGYNSESFSF